MNRRTVALIGLGIFLGGIKMGYSETEMDRYRSDIDKDGFIAVKVDASKLSKDEKTIYDRYRECVEYDLKNMQKYAEGKGIAWKEPSDDEYINTGVPRWAYPIYGGHYYYRVDKLGLGLPKEALRESDASLYEERGRSFASLRFHTRAGWMNLGEVAMSAKHLISRKENALALELAYPHDRLNLTTGGKLDKGVLEGKMKIALMADEARFSVSIRSLKDYEKGFPLGLWMLDADQFDDSFVWHIGADGKIIQRWVDLGVEAGLKEPPAGQTFPCPLDSLKKNQFFFLSREGVGVLFEAEISQESKMKRYTEEDLEKIGRFSIAGVHVILQGDGFSFLVDYQAFPQGAELKATWRLKAFDMTDVKRLPKFSYPPLDWKEARFFDSHGHLDFRHNILASVRKLRKNKMVFGVLSLYFVEGTSARKFFGDWPAYVAMKAYPDVFAGFGNIQLNPGGYPGCSGSPRDTVEKIDLLHRLGFHGIKNIEKWVSDVRVDDKEFDPLYRRMEQLGMPIVYHAGAGPKLGEPGGHGHSSAHVAEVARRFPKLFVGIAHGGSKNYRYSYLHELPNLYTQHMHYMSQEDLMDFKKRGLIRKIIFGSDAQGAVGINSAWKLKKLLKEIELSDEDIHWCCGGYMLEWLRKSGK